MPRLFLLAILGLAWASSVAADWRQFRGTDSTGVSSETALPEKWTDTENLAWKVDLPGRGLSSPIVVGDKVFVTACSGPRQTRLHVLCFEAGSGKKLWERQYWTTGRTSSHPKTCNAAPTPCSDGERVYVTFSSNDVVCLNLEGDLEWYRGLTHDFPNASNSLGMSSSSVVVGQTLVCMVECDAESFSTGLNSATGEPRWKIDRPRKANWTSPVVLTGASPADSRVLIQSSKGVVAVVPDTGLVEWEYSNGASTIPSIAINSGTAYVPSNGITALRPTPSKSEAPEMLWNEGGLSPGTASPIVYNDRLYVVNNAGVVNCADLKDGKRLWQLRLKGPFSGSPVAASGRLYLFNEEGLGQVVELGATEGKILSQHSFGEAILSTPAIAGGAIYIRSDGHLWKIAAK